MRFCEDRFGLSFFKSQFLNQRQQIGQCLSASGLICQQQTLSKTKRPKRIERQTLFQI